MTPQLHRQECFRPYLPDNLSLPHAEKAAEEVLALPIYPELTPEMIEYVLHLCDLILVMTVNPGFGGQAFLPEMLPKIRRIRALCAERGHCPVIEVDGGKNAMTAAPAAAAGAAGSAIFGTIDYNSSIAAIRGSATAAEVEPRVPQSPVARTVTRSSA